MLVAAPDAVALGFEEPVQRLGFQSGAFGQSLGGAACRCSQRDPHFLGAEDDQDGVDDGCFAHTGTARDHEQALAQSFLHRLLLALSELLASLLRAPGDGFVGIHLGIGSGLGEQLLELRCDAAFGQEEVRQIEHRLPGYGLPHQQ